MQLVNSIHRRAFQPAKSGHSFGRQLFSLLLLYRTPHLPAASRTTPSAAIHFSLPAPHNRQQPTTPKHQPTPTTPTTSFLTEQISVYRHPATLLSPIPSSFHSFHHPTSQSLPAFIIPLSPLTSHKKTEPSAQLFPLYISSTFPGLYNPQFSSCSTKPKCLRMPAKSGSLLLSSVITGLSFFSHSRLNSISLLPRPL